MMKLKMGELRCLIIIMLAVMPAVGMAGNTEPADTVREQELEEVTVVARRDLIRSDGAKLTYDVENDPMSSTSTVMEMLRRVPMVSVDGDDNIRVKGNTNFKIYVNGKPDPMLSGDPKSVLKAMPASSIKRIEVITDPGAKYEAEGTAGILNIITVQKQAVEGYTGNVRAGISNNGYSGTLYGRAKAGNVTASARLNGNRQSGIFVSSIHHNSEREDFDSDTDHWYRTASKSRYPFSYFGAGLDLSWEPDTLNLFTFSFNWHQIRSLRRSDQFMSMWDKEEQLQWSYRRDYHNQNKRLGTSANVSYQHTFPANRLHTLTLTYQFDFGRGYERADQYACDYVGLPSGYEPYRKHDTRNYYGTHTLQADYVLPLFDDRHTFEAGGKMVIRPNRETEWDSSSADGVDFLRDSYIKLTQHNDVYAGYLSYNAKFGKFSGRAGIRYEHSRLGIDYRRVENMGQYTDFSRRLNDWVPNASLTYALTDGSNLRLAYSMRIRRPDISQLNPFVDDMVFGEIEYGNPNLKSEKRQTVELKYSNYGGKLSGEVTASYSRSDNSMEEYRFMKDGIMNITTANIGHYQSFDVGAWLEYSITDAMDVSGWVGTAYEHYRARSLDNLSNHGLQTAFSLNYSYTLPIKLRLDVWGGMWTPWIDLQGKGETTGYYYGLSLSRGFIKDDALRLTLSAGNFLQGTTHNNYTYITPTTATFTATSYHTWQVGFSISYRFGSLRKDVRRTNASVSNDDVGGGESKTGK